MACAHSHPTHRFAMQHVRVKLGEYWAFFDLSVVSCAHVCLGLSFALHLYTVGCTPVWHCHVETTTNTEMVDSRRVKHRVWWPASAWLNCARPGTKSSEIIRSSSAFIFCPTPASVCPADFRPALPQGIRARISSNASEARVEITVPKKSKSF